MATRRYFEKDAFMLYLGGDESDGCGGLVVDGGMDEHNHEPSNINGEDALLNCDFTEMVIVDANGGADESKGAAETPQQDALWSQRATAAAASTVIDAVAGGVEPDDGCDDVVSNQPTGVVELDGFEAGRMCEMVSEDISYESMPMPAVETSNVGTTTTLAPEHTLMSFQRAIEQNVYGVQADVMISYDGVPFLMHDRTLRRTTNVVDVFPASAKEHPSMFNWTELEMLNSGLWFLENDPFWTAGSFSAAVRFEAGNQSICKLTALLQMARQNGTAVLLNLPVPPEDHPYRDDYINITVETILQSGIPQRLVIWLPDFQRRWVREVAPDFQQASGIKRDVKHLREEGITRLNLRYTQTSQEDIRNYTAGNLSTNLYNINEPWLYSVLWCTGVQSVTTDATHILTKIPFPVWLMSPDEYYLIWITADLISFTVIIGVFILQKWRLGNIRTYNPEQIMLNAAVRRTSREVNIMKEKLIFSEISNGMDNADEMSLYSEHGYDGYANEAVTPIDQQGTNVCRS